MKTTGKWMIAAMLTVLMAILISGCGKKITEVDLSNFYSVQIEGCNGAGIARVQFDEKALEDAIFSRLLENKKIEAIDAASVYDAAFSDQAVFNLVDTAFSDSIWSLDKDSGLSNGDEITLTFNYDNESYEDTGIRLAGDTVTFKVEGLPEVQKYDAFEGMNVNFSGVSPFGAAEIQNAKYTGELNYELDKMYGLKNGDVVTVTIETLPGADVSREPAELKKEFTVQGLREYIVSIDQIPEEAWNKLKKELDDQKAANIDITGTTTGVIFEGVGGWGYVEAGFIDKINNFTWDKAYLLSARDGDDPEVSFGTTYNRLLIVYSCDVAGGRNDEFLITINDTPDMRGAFYIDNLVLDQDGTMLIPAGDIMFTNAVKGEDMFVNENVIPYQDEYNIEEASLNW